ncbi:MAG TPA: LptE family protein [Bacteroidales bacterium]|nr:LptE family protein [Bacteroidales bacterium]
MGLNLSTRYFSSEKILMNLFMALFIAMSGCKVSYSFSGASISPQIRTLSVQNFLNRAPLVQPGLDQTFTDALIDKCKAQTGLEIVSNLGDVSFEGEITDYRTMPLTVAADAYAAMNRFSITVRVKFINTVDSDLSFDQTFTRYEDYDSNLDLSAVEQDLVEKIVELIIEDIFNKAFVNW